MLIPPQTGSYVWHWFGFDHPLLPQAAQWLLDRLVIGAGSNGEPGEADGSNLICLVPGRRAGRTLLALLAEGAEARELVLLPPKILTPGALVEVVIGSDSPTATDSEHLLAWLEALRTTPREVLEPLVPGESNFAEPEIEVDVLDLLDLARAAQRLEIELAGELLRFHDVPLKAECLELFAEGDRWSALASVAERCAAILRETGLANPADRVRHALEQGAYTSVPELVLVGVTELNQAQRILIDAAAETVHVLIHAPESLSERFDDHGCVREANEGAGGWQDAQLSLRDDELIVAETPSDQAQAAVEQVATLAKQFAADEITIGVGDAELVDPFRRAAQWVGLHAHASDGKPLARSGPFRLLRAIAAYIDDPRFAGFAAMLRHPDLERWLRDRTNAHAAGERAIGEWLTLLDCYFSDHLHERPTGAWLGDAERNQPLKIIWELIHRLIAPLVCDASSPAACSAAVIEVLSEVYGDLSPQEASLHERATIEACLALRDRLERWRMAEPRLQPQLSASAALHLLLHDLAIEHQPDQVQADQLDVLGWLELHLDPAPALVVLGLNEGAIPESVSADLFLPDSLRRALGLMDNARRYARDAYRLEAIRRSRASFCAIIGRRSAAGDPLVPSRLVFACDDDAMLARVERFCAEDTRSGQSRKGSGRPLPAGIADCGTQSQFNIPPLPENLALPTSMNVTDFRRYLACPYRYALERLAKIKSLSDCGREIDAMVFGVLAHEALESLCANDSLRDVDDPKTIEACLLDALADCMHRRFGDQPMPAVRLQRARLEQRLIAFAPQQAGWRRAGWRTLHTEYKFADHAALELPDEESMPLRGKIDRIDQHETSGALRIIDYKTGDSRKSPNDVHHGLKTVPKDCTAADAWKDLQLPLYHYLAQREFADLIRNAGEIELAYVVLPKKAEDIGLASAQWTAAHLSAAVDHARQVVRDIRARRFPLNRDYKSSYDDFARICKSLSYSNDDGENFENADDFGGGE